MKTSTAWKLVLVIVLWTGIIHAVVADDLDNPFPPNLPGDPVIVCTADRCETITTY